MRTKILVVDDAPIARTGTALSLISLGFEVDQAESGLEALNKIKQTNYAVILMDYHMPEMNGCECTRLIRQYESKAAFRTPIVCLTANELAKVNQACFDAGMDDCLSKMAPIEDLKEIITRLKVPVLQNRLI